MSNIYRNVESLQQQILLRDGGGGGGGGGAANHSRITMSLCPQLEHTQQRCLDRCETNLEHYRCETNLEHYSTD